MDLLLTNTPQARHEDGAVIRAIMPDFEPATVLSITGGTHGEGAPEDGAVNAYAPQRLGSFRRAAIGSSINLFAGEFALAFIRHARDLLEPGGELAVIRTGASSRGVNGFLSTDRIEQEFGGRRVQGLGPRGDMVANVVAATPHRDARPSVLRTYLENFAEVTEARVGLMLETLRRGDIDFALPPPAEIEALERRFGNRQDGLRKQVMQVDAYFVDAGRFKAPILAHILATFLGGRTISIADIGSGAGIVPMELCLDGRLKIDLAIAVDASPSFRATAEAILRHLDLGRRLGYVTATAEDFAFGRSFDAICYVSSLFHVRKDAVSAVVDRAWEALRPGGILVVWENVRSPSSAAQLDYMFTAAGIDAELGRLGGIRYFLSTAAKEIMPDKVGDQAVFRVVRKTG